MYHKIDIFITNINDELWQCPIRDFDNFENLRSVEKTKWEKKMTYGTNVNWDHKHFLNTLTIQAAYSWMESSKSEPLSFSELTHNRNKRSFFFELVG